MSRLFIVILLLTPLSVIANPIRENDLTKIKSAINHTIRKMGGIEHLYQQAKSERPEALYTLGQMYRLGILKKQNIKKAKALFLKAAKQEHALSVVLMATIGRCMDLLTIELPCKNTHDYMYWLEKAAYLGFAPEQYQLGQFFLTGNHKTIDQDLGLFWLNRAASNGSLQARAALAALGRDQRYQADFNRIRGLANKGDPNALMRLANLYFEGVVVVMDLTKSRQLADSAKKAGATQRYLGDDSGRASLSN